MLMQVLVVVAIGHVYGRHRPGSRTVDEPAPSADQGDRIGLRYQLQSFREKAMDRLGPHQALELFGAIDTRGEDHCRCLLQKEISVSCSPTTYQPISLKSLTSPPRIGHCPQNALRTFGGLPAGHSAGHSP